MAVTSSGRSWSLSTELHSSTEGLPKAFLLSLRTLFDILDDQQRGYVHILEIESRWQGTDTRELPKGVLECLRKVAPASGYLTFEKFVLGLRRSILNPDAGDNVNYIQSKGNGSERSVGSSCRYSGSVQKPKTVYSLLEKKPLGVRYMNGTAENRARNVAKIPCSQELKTGSYRTEVQRNGSQNPGQVHVNAPQGEQAGRNGKLVGRSQSKSNSAAVVDVRQHHKSRGEHRRHTITNGVDYSMLKYMKELEQEKDFLIQGLEMLERAREWYHQQIQSVQERQKHLGKNQTQTEFLSEESQGHLSYLLPKLQDVNHCLSDLLSYSGKPVKSLPAVNGFVAPVVGQHQTITMLKEQNRLLTKEVTDKSDRITQLEQEKSALIKQLFEARARSHQEASQLDSTFI
uniref:Suppressor APC domain-containing protein 2 isoform X2 n=1 Tax=Geotrypetes seraphini TaxID=260995 RepID=A0A6P8SC24_GEOSA|nr:suppressor APC domain-containing protein 2 isoform X2 [Geotrypetes seraphini]